MSAVSVGYFQRNIIGKIVFPNPPLCFRMVPYNQFSFKSDWSGGRGKSDPIDLMVNIINIIRQFICHIVTEGETIITGQLTRLESHICTFHVVMCRILHVLCTYLHIRARFLMKLVCQSVNKLKTNQFIIFS